ncbi:MAG: CrcB family protein, partial [Rhodoglobus sp.]
MIAVIAAVLAGAVAAGARWTVSRWVRAPWGVLAVNVVGSGIGGVVLGLAQRGAVSGDIRLVLIGGLCGGLTTFSTWSVETVQLVQDGKWRTAALSVGANLFLG